MDRTVVHRTAWCPGAATAIGPRRGPLRLRRSVPGCRAPPSRARSASTRRTGRQGPRGLWHHHPATSD